MRLIIAYCLIGMLLAAVAIGLSRWRMLTIRNRRMHRGRQRY